MKILGSFGLIFPRKIPPSSVSTPSDCTKLLQQDVSRFIQYSYLCRNFVLFILVYRIHKVHFALEHHRRNRITLPNLNDVVLSVNS